MIDVGNWCEAAHEPDNGVGLWLNGMFILGRHAQARKDKERPEDVDMDTDIT